MVNGVIIIKKEKGYTSHDVVASLRGIIGQKKIGHTGTLDPMATGVLPVCLGNATKLCDFLTDESKEYETLMHLGLVSDTQDITGKILYNSTSREVDINNKNEGSEIGDLYDMSKYSRSGVDITLPEFEEAVSHFTGNIMQTPPMYSAKKVNGKKLYELAREGKVVERKERPIEIFDIKIENFNPPYARLIVKCSKGTYIRTLCHDIGTYLKCGAVMETLERTRVGRFYLSEAYELSEVKELKEEGRLSHAVLKTDFFFLDHPAVHVKKDSMKLLLNGNKFAKEDIYENKEPHEVINPNTGERDFCIHDLLPGETKPRVRVYDSEEVFYGIYEYEHDSGIFKPVQMFMPM